MVILLIALLVFCFWGYIKDKNILNPQFVFNFVWFITLYLYELKLSRIQQDLSDRTILAFWTSVICYNFAILLFDYIKFPRLNFRKQDKVRSYKKRRHVAKRIVLWIFVLEMLYSKGIPLIWIIVGNSKTYFDYGVPSLHGAWCGLVVCLGAYSLFRKTKDKWLYLVLPILLITRQIMMSIIIEGFVYAFYMKNVKSKFESLNQKKKINIKFFIISALVIVIIFTVIGNFRSGKDVMDRIFQARDNVNLPSSIKWFYSYMTFSVSNFNNLVGITQGSENNGTSMLIAILPTVLQRLFRIRENYSPYYLISPNYTVSTYLSDIYLDFGIFGIGIFNFFIGVIGYILYKNIRCKKTARGVLLYAVYIHNILLLFFTNFFLFLPIVIQIFYISHLFSNRRKFFK